MDIKGCAPDLLSTFNVDPEAYHRSNACVIAEQGKRSDLVLEFISPSTGRIGIHDKTADHAAWDIPEYWCFDEAGESQGTRLTGDKTSESAELPDGSLEGL